MSNINDNYFDGLYQEIWRKLIPGLLTEKEINFILSFFRLQPGTKVLDLMCGYGRHAIALGRKGIEVTAVDNLGSYITEIREIAESESLPVQAVQADVLTYVPADKFQLAICMGNSLNFYDKDDTISILTRTAAALAPGGHLLVNTWSLAEIAIPSFKDKSSATVNGIECFTEGSYLFHPSRIESATKFIAADGTIEEKMAVDYIFSVNEMEMILEESGFDLDEIYSIPGKKKFSLGEPRAYIIARRKTSL